MLITHALTQDTFLAIFIINHYYHYRCYHYINNICPPSVPPRLTDNNLEHALFSFASTANGFNMKDVATWQKILIVDTITCSGFAPFVYTFHKVTICGNITAKYVHVRDVDSQRILIMCQCYLLYSIYVNFT